jgi:hypothetical protein
MRAPAASWARSTRPRTRSSTTAVALKTIRGDVAGDAKDEGPLPARVHLSPHGDAPERLPHLRRVPPWRPRVILSMELISGENALGPAEANREEMSPSDALPSRRADGGRAPSRGRRRGRHPPRTSRAARSRCSFSDERRPGGSRAVVTGLRPRAPHRRRRAALSLTETETVSGSAGLHAPEQIEGPYAHARRGHITRSGFVLYEMVSRASRRVPGRPRPPLGPLKEACARARRPREPARVGARPSGRLGPDDIRCPMSASARSEGTASPRRSTYPRGAALGGEIPGQPCAWRARPPPDSPVRGARRCSSPRTAAVIVMCPNP